MIFHPGLTSFQFYLPLFLFLTLLTGCQTIQTKKEMGSFEDLYKSGSYNQAANLAMKQGEITQDGKSESLLWALQAGAALSCSEKKNYAKANNVLDGAESFMKIEDLENLLKKGGEQIAAVLLNSTFNDYAPTVYDGVMVNTIKATNFFKLHDYQNARIEFNRTAERQRLAEKFFNKKIEEQNKKKKQESSRNNFDNNMTSSQKVVGKNFPELSEWDVYPDFVNPYTDYIHSLFFLLTGEGSSDIGKARDSIRRVAGMVPNNEAVRTDLLVIDNVSKGRWSRSELKPAVWVIFENGLSPKINELIIPLPLVLVTNKIDYMQIALPKLVEREAAFPYLEVSSNTVKNQKTEQLASIDRVVQTEFKKEYPYRVTQAIMSTVVKALIQKELKKKGDIASLLGAIYQAVTTRADTRSWTALPKEFQVARLRKPTDGKLTIAAPGSTQVLKVNLPEGQFAIVHVKATTKNSDLSYSVIAL